MDHALKFRPYSGAMAKHYKGGIYTIIATARHTETWEELVIYRDCENRMFARPASMFFEYLSELGCHRFEFIGRETNSPMDTKVNLMEDGVAISLEGDKHLSY